MKPTAPSLRPEPGRAGAHGVSVGFGLIMALLLALTGLGAFHLHTMNQAVRNIVEVHNEQFRLAAEMVITARERALQLQSILHEPDPFLRDERTPRFHELAGRFRGARQALLKMPLDAVERALLEQQNVHTTRGSLLQDMVLDLAQSERMDEANRLLLSEAIPAQDRAMRELQRFLDRQVEDGRTAAAVASKQVRTATTLNVTGGVIALILAASIAVVVSRRQKRLVADLDNANRELQTRVEERTRALSEALKQLEADIEARKQAQAQLHRQNQELNKLNHKLQDAQGQLLQSEKMASIGQLAAGVAHEINNPIGFVNSNLGTLDGYVADLLDALETYAGHAGALPEAIRDELTSLRRRLDLDFLKEDIPALLKESRDGIDRVRKIVQDLKDFSRLDSSPEWQFSDLRQGLESTLNIAHNEIKYRAQVQTEFADLPPVECLPSQLNQVFLNLLVNAAQAMPEGANGVIAVRTAQLDADQVVITVADNGKGIPPEIIKRIFDPFFTTKPVGQGTGLGLSLAYGIVQKHHGRFEVESEPGKGSTFRIILPVRQPAAEASEQVGAGLPAIHRELTQPSIAGKPAPTA